MPVRKRAGQLLMTRGRDLEKLEQQALIVWVTMKTFTHRCDDGRTISINLRDVFEASLNGTHLRGSKGQRMGAWADMVKSGATKNASDLSLNYPSPCGKYHGMKIEMKKRRDQFPNPSSIRAAMKPGQADHLHLMGRLGYHAIFCFGWVEAANAISEYMGWSIPFPQDES